MIAESWKVSTDRLECGFLDSVERPTNLHEGHHDLLGLDAARVQSVIRGNGIVLDVGFPVLEMIELVVVDVDDIVGNAADHSQVVHGLPFLESVSFFGIHVLTL